MSTQEELLYQLSSQDGLSRKSYNFVSSDKKFFKKLEKLGHEEHFNGRRLFRSLLDAYEDYRVILNYFE